MAPNLMRLLGSMTALVGPTCMIWLPALLSLAMVMTWKEFMLWRFSNAVLVIETPYSL
jgi:hypothetical protein